MYCSNCGNKLDEDSKFCSNCGKKLGGEGGATTQQQTQQVQGFRNPNMDRPQNPNYSRGNYPPPPNGKSKAPLIALALALPLILIIGAVALFSFMPRNTPEDTVMEMFSAFEDGDIDRFMDVILVDDEILEYGYLDEEEFKREIEEEMIAESDKLKAEIGSGFLKHIELVTTSEGEDRATVEAIYKEEIIGDYFGEDTFELERVDGKWLILLD